ncbi:MAG: potassium channel family protein [Acidimicrobiales bacterium]
MPRIEIRDRTLRDIALGQDSYILLFVLLLVDYLVLILIDSPRWAGLWHIVPLAITVLVGLHTSGSKRRTLHVASALLLFAFLAALAQAINDDRPVGAVAFLTGALLLAATGLAIMGRILRHRHVSIETMFGAVDVYILIGLFFSSLFLAMALISAKYHLGSFFAQPGSHDSSDYVYFSFITLTTVGFGDLTPLTNMARSVTVLEALIGQIFLVTLVARLVTLFGIEQPHLAGAEEEALPPSEIAPDPFVVPQSDEI